MQIKTNQLNCGLSKTVSLGFSEQRKTTRATLKANVSVNHYIIRTHFQSVSFHQPRQPLNFHLNAEFAVRPKRKKKEKKKGKYLRFVNVAIVAVIKFYLTTIKIFIYSLFTRICSLHFTFIESKVFGALLRYVGMLCVHEHFVVFVGRREILWFFLSIVCPPPPPTVPVNVVTCVCVCVSCVSKYFDYDFYGDWMAWNYWTTEFSLVLISVFRIDCPRDPLTL